MMKISLMLRPVQGLTVNVKLADQVGEVELLEMDITVVDALS